MKFDHPTAYFLLGLLQVLVPLGVWILLRSMKQVAALFWCGGGLILGFGTLWSSNPYVSYPYYGLVAAVLFASGILLKIRALRVLLDRRDKVFRYLLVIVAYVAVEGFVEAFGTKITRSLFFAVTHFLLYAYLVHLAFQVYRRLKSSGALWIVGAHVFVLALLAVAVVSVMTNSDAQPWRSGWVGILMALTGLLVVLTNHVAFISLTLDAVRSQSKSEIRSIRDSGPLGELLRRIGWFEEERVLPDVSRKIIHEFNQPLAAMTSTVNLMSRAWKDKRWSDLDFEKILGRLQRSLEIASQLISSIRPLAVHKETSRQSVMVEELLNNTMELLFDSRIDKRLDIKISGVTSACVLGNYPELVRLLINLFKNSIDASLLSGRKPEISIGVSADEDAVSIIFSDYGPGFSAEALLKAGREFFTTKREGMGVGLFICRQIAEEHGGGILFANHSDGARVSLHLPAAKG